MVREILLNQVVLMTWQLKKGIQSTKQESIIIFLGVHHLEIVKYQVAKLLFNFLCVSICLDVQGSLERLNCSIDSKLSEALYSACKKGDKGVVARMHLKWNLVNCITQDYFIKLTSNFYKFEVQQFRDLTLHTDRQSAREPVTY